MAKRTKKTVSSSNSESESEPKRAPEPIRAYIPITEWSFNAKQKMFTLKKQDGGIMVLDINHLIILADPFVFDLERLPLYNPDNRADGRVAIKWAKGLEKVLIGER